ncbi:hypothetical protein NFI96_006496 [Prochilodus magdalenae]|nr:hypothetical protein NFI96_006496 [Prochilodus magdalenae]
MEDTTARWMPSFVAVGSVRCKGLRGGGVGVCGRPSVCSVYVVCKAFCMVVLGHLIPTGADIQQAVVSSMYHPVSAAPSADGCTTQDYMHTDRVLNTTSPSPKTAVVSYQTVMDSLTLAVSVMIPTIVLVEMTKQTRYGGSVVSAKMIHVVMRHVDHIPKTCRHSTPTAPSAGTVFSTMGDVAGTPLPCLCVCLSLLSVVTAEWEANAPLEILPCETGINLIHQEAFASFDLRGAHGLSHDPMPKKAEENSHGTKCAGEVAMEANNSFCGVGIAFNARIGGIRLLDGSVTDSMEATALTYNNDFIDIYTCCWGPRDNGAVMAGPATLTEKALRLGTRKGRGGKGSIFVWAAGNGGIVNDHCGADGYVNSIYTIAIGAITHTGSPASFGEPCPGVMAVTLTGTNTINSLPLSVCVLYMSRTSTDCLSLPVSTLFLCMIVLQVTVSNLGDGCITHFAGTSSAAPIAAGVLALVLEANPDLTWRDVQHLIAKTAKIPDPKEPGWTINGAGYHVHDSPKPPYPVPPTPYLLPRTSYPVPPTPYLNPVPPTPYLLPRTSYPVPQPRPYPCTLQTLSWIPCTPYNVPCTP